MRAAARGGFNGQPELNSNAALGTPTWGTRATFDGSARVESGLPVPPPVKPLTVRFAKTGSYTFFCDVHPGMKGVVHVVAHHARVPAGAGPRAGADAADRCAAPAGRRGAARRRGSIVPAAMLVAIDGPAGAGKSTVARAAAAALGFRYLDTGAMYRAVALAGDRDPASLRLDFAGDGRVLLDGEDVGDAIRTPEVAQRASQRATDPAVRAALVRRQRELVARGDWVAEGRDVGTVVAPGAELKVWLTAALAERARRRGTAPEEVRRRDERDAGRDHAPMVAAPDAVEVDTTGLTVGEVVARIVALARERGAVAR